jgi:hypothetical protein
LGNCAKFIGLLTGNVKTLVLDIAYLLHKQSTIIIPGRVRNHSQLRVIPYFLHSSILLNQGQDRNEIWQIKRLLIVLHRVLGPRDHIDQFFQDHVLDAPFLNLGFHGSFIKLIETPGDQPPQIQEIISDKSLIFVNLQKPILNPKRNQSIILVVFQQPTDRAKENPAGARVHRKIFSGQKIIQNHKRVPSQFIAVIFLGFHDS